MVDKERIQKKMSSEYSPWDPIEQARSCLAGMEKDVNECSATSLIGHTGCVFGNSEAAFYEGMIGEEEMTMLKEKTAEYRHDFSNKCKCGRK